MRARALLRLTALAAQLFVGAAAAQLGLPETPPDAKPGECYGLVYVPPQFRSSEASKLVAAASERIETVPAVYEMVDEKVTLPAGKRRRVVTPAVTETVEETVVVPSQKRQVAVPVTYKTVSEQVTVAQGAQLKTSKLLDSSEGAAICLVEGPTTRQTVQKRVVDRPASTRLVQTAASERIVKRRKVITPAVTELVPVGERTITRRVKKLVTPATTRAVPVPARYETVTRHEIDKPARAEWQRVLCETNFTPALVQSLQEALKREGIYKGPAHGDMNTQTAAAVRLYQERKQMPTGGLSLTTLESLGVSLGEGQTMSLRRSATSP